jgi:MFS family permease
MGDLVPEAQRGAYFGRRSRYLQVATFAGLIIGGLLLWRFKHLGFEYGGFVAAFSLAAIARAISLGFLLVHWEPPVSSPPTLRTLTAVFATLRHPDQRALIFYLALMSFGVYLAAPFFSAYMLRRPDQHGLEWSYVTFTLVNGITVFFKFVFLPLWGAASDRFGSRKCLVLAGWLVSFLPLVWLVPHGNQTLYFAAICLVQTWGGLAWGGHELCSFNFLLDSARAEDRPGLVASMNIVNGLMAFLGSMTGALVVSLAPAYWNPFLVVFFCSGLARFTVCAALLPRLHEVRVVERISYRDLFFRVSSVRATMGPVIRFFVLPTRRGEGT